MKPLHEADIDALRHVQVVLTDVDDTLTRGGRLDASTLAAMERLEQADIAVVPVTGGCAGWCDHIVRAWPVAAVIGESGAFAFRKSSSGGLNQRFVRPREELRDEQRRLLGLAERAMAIFPGAHLAADQPYRLADIAIDHAQDVAPPLDPETVAGLINYIREGGARARASSIHVNAWFGNHDKASTAKWILEEDFHLDYRAQRSQVLFIGDAPNDESLFDQYPISVGVNNITPHLDSMQSRPRWLCDASHGYGFTEMVEQLLAKHQSCQRQPAG